MPQNPHVHAFVLAVFVASTVQAQGAAQGAAQDGAQEAQDTARPRSSALPEWVEADPFTEGEDDPLGVLPAEQLEHVSPTTPDEEVQRPVPIRRGEVLAAISGVREVSHEVEVSLDDGLALVRTRMRFVSRARHAAEVRYRLAVPPDASLAHLEVCDPRGCREGALDDSQELGPYDDAVRARGRGASLPIAHAALVQDDRGHALWIRAAPMAARRPGVTQDDGVSWLEVRVSYLVSAPMHGRRARFVLPARGHDNRVAPSRIRVRSTALTRGTADGTDAVELPVERAPSESVEIAAHQPSLRAAGPIDARIWTSPCGTGTCARVRVVGRAQTDPRPRELFLLLDASPSTAGAARGRIMSALTALLSSLPSTSTVHITVFAAQAEPVVRGGVPPTEISVVQVGRALERQLGSATRFESAWRLISPAVRAATAPLVVILGDGGLTHTERTDAAFRAARDAGAELAVLNVADRPTTAVMRTSLELAEGRFIDVGPQAARAAAGHGMDPLVERMSSLRARVLQRRVHARVGGQTIELGVLRAGEELVWEGLVPQGRVRLLRPRGISRGEPPSELAFAIRDRLERRTGRRTRPAQLAAVASTMPAPQCSMRVRPESASPVAPAGTRVILSDRRHCGRSPLPSPTPTAPPSAQTDHLRPHTGRTGLPERALLSILRQRIVPAARSCFRADRRGRASYQRRAVFEFRLADREVQFALIRGSIAPSLRACLSSAMDTLEIPPFDGVVNVRYPVYTSARLPPPVLTLDTDVADAVDATLLDPATLPDADSTPVSP